MWTSTLEIEVFEKAVSGERWNHNYTSKATEVLTSDFMFQLYKLCVHTQTPRVESATYRVEWHSNSIYFLLKLANWMKISILGDRIQMKHDKLVNAATRTCPCTTLQWAGWEWRDKPHILPRCAGQHEIKEKPEEEQVPAGSGAGRGLQPRPHSCSRIQVCVYLGPVLLRKHFVEIHCIDRKIILFLLVIKFIT